jgi:hypothetical protein
MNNPPLYRRKKQPLCPRCMRAPKYPGEGYCRECKYSLNRERYRRMRERLPRLVLSGNKRVCVVCKFSLAVECFSPNRNECKVCRSVRRGELERGAERCKPWQRKGLKKAVSHE